MEVSKEGALFYAVGKDLEWKTYASLGGGQKIEWRVIQKSHDDHSLMREWRYVSGDQLVISDNLDKVIEAFKAVGE